MTFTLRDATFCSSTVGTNEAEGWRDDLTRRPGWLEESDENLYLSQIVVKFREFR
jgi:hypothetical protein